MMTNVNDQWGLAAFTCGKSHILTIPYLDMNFKITVEPFWKGQECLPKVAKFGTFPCTVLYKSCFFYPSWQATSFERPPFGWPLLRGSTLLIQFSTCWIVYYKRFIHILNYTLDWLKLSRYNQFENNNTIMLSVPYTQYHALSTCVARASAGMVLNLNWVSNISRFKITRASPGDRWVEAGNGQNYAKVVHFQMFFLK